MNEIKPYVGPAAGERARRSKALTHEPVSLDKRLVRQLKHWAGELLYYPLMAVAHLPIGMGWARAEARRISVTREDIFVPHTPAEFDGMTFAFLTDLHCSTETPPGFLEQVIAETNALRPDFILLGGDYVTEGTAYLAPVTELLAKLQAPLGVYGVLGNHDHTVGANRVRAALKKAGVVNVNNGGRWLTRGKARLRVAGVGDLWEDRQDLDAALDGIKMDDCVILLSHNPDYATRMRDARVGLMLSGHTHGGQIRLPYIGALITNSRFGKMLSGGWVKFESFHLYVSRGIGTVVVPMRYHCPPEIALFTLRSTRATE